MSDVGDESAARRAVSEDRPRKREEKVTSVNVADLDRGEWCVIISLLVLSGGYRMKELRRRLERRIRIHRRRHIARVAAGSGGLFALAGMLMVIGWWFPPVWIAVGVLAIVGVFFLLSGVGAVTGLEFL